MARAADQPSRQHGAVHVGVVAHHARRQHRQQRVFVDAEAVVARHRCIVDRSDFDRHRRHVRLERSVFGPVAEPVAAKVVRHRGVGKAAVGIECQAAMQRTIDQGRVQRIAVDVSIVAQHAGAGDRQRVVLDHRVAIRSRHRRIVHRIDDERDGGHVGISSAIVYEIGETVGAEVVRIRRVGQPPVRKHHHRTMRRPAVELNRQRTAADGAVVRTRVEREWRILGGLDTVRLRHRRPASIVEHEMHVVDDNAAAQRTEAEQVEVN